MYEWNAGSHSPTIEIATPGHYSVSIITECYSIEEHVQVTLSADCDPQIFIPNVFSPNNDNVNDFWEVLIDPSIDVIGIECSVFDRWGNIVFNAASTPIEWDGSFNGRVMLPGVYVYVVTIQRVNDVTDLITGSLTIIR
jgi:gliding motility-associated-like protein